MPNLAKYFAFALVAAGYAGAGLAAAPAPAAAGACPAPEAVFEAGQRQPGMLPPRIAMWPIVPPYPSTLPQGQTGIVSADYVVRTDGTACNVQVKALQGPQAFADTAAAWLAGVPFAPASKDGKPIAGEMKRLFRMGAIPSMHPGMHPMAPPAQPLHPFMPTQPDTPDEN